MDREAFSRLIATRAGDDWAAPEKTDEHQGFDRREEQKRVTKHAYQQNGISSMRQEALTCQKRCSRPATWPSTGSGRLPNLRQRQQATPAAPGRAGSQEVHFSFSLHSPFCVLQSEFVAVVILAFALPFPDPGKGRKRLRQHEITGVGPLASTIVQSFSPKGKLPQPWNREFFPEFPSVFSKKNPPASTKAPLPPYDCHPYD